MMYRWIKEFYEIGLYDDATIDLFIRVGDITAEQGQEIKGK